MEILGKEMRYEREIKFIQIKKKTFSIHKWWSYLYKNLNVPYKNLKTSKLIQIIVYEDNTQRAVVSVHTNNLVNYEIMNYGMLK